MIAIKIMAIEIKYEHFNLSDFVVFKPITINRIWGASYMIMDGHSFKSGIGGEDYTKMIDLFIKMWEEVGYMVLDLL